jgi:hypothetical protein
MASEHCICESGQPDNLDGESHREVERSFAAVDQYFDAKQCGAVATGRALWIAFGIEANRFRLAKALATATDYNRD